MRLSKSRIVLIIIFVILIIDQASKFWIKTNMTLGESFPVIGDWFNIYFIENDGMAYGFSFGGKIGKLVLTFARLFFIGFIIHYLRKLIKESAPMGVLVGISLILVGALGNIIDNIFYGLLFSESTYSTVAEFLPGAGLNYAPLLFGKVVDMLYFPLFETTLPNWLPIWGGENYLFFSPIFNIADSCITVGFAYLLLFEKSFFKKL